MCCQSFKYVGGKPFADSLAVPGSVKATVGTVHINAYHPGPVLRQPSAIVLPTEENIMSHEKPSLIEGTKYSVLKAGTEDHMVDIPWEVIPTEETTFVGMAKSAFCNPPVKNREDVS